MALEVWQTATITIKLLPLSRPSCEALLAGESFATIGIYFATTQDGDADGLDDIVEFATAGNPTNPQDRGTLTSGLNEVSAGQTGLTLTFAAPVGATFAAAPDSALPRRSTASPAA